MSTFYEYVIIGGGVTGLTAAYELSKHSSSVCLIEPGELGGCVQSSQIAGFSLDHGPATFVLTPAMKSLLTELGLMDMIVEPSIKRIKQYVWYNSAPHKIPKSLTDFFCSELFTWREKIALASGLFRSLHRGDVSETMSLAALFGVLLGKGVVKKVLDPALR